MWLCIGLIAIFSAIFITMSTSKPSSMPDPNSNPPPITNLLELDNTLKELDKLDTTSQINSELVKLSSDAAGI